MKIDTSAIEGFDSLTPEEQVKALLETEYQDTSAGSVEKHYKELISKANSEAKKYKDAARSAEEKLKSQMSEDERTQQEQAERYKAIEEENASLKREAQIIKKTAFYKSLGFDNTLAEETATAFADGDFATVEQNHLKAHTNFEKEIRADVARANPHPNNNGVGTKTITKAEIMAIKDTAKRQKLIAEHMDLFRS